MRVRAADPTTLFVCAALAMFALMDLHVDQTAEELTVAMTLDAMDIESLMVDWLSELVYLHETTGVVFDLILIQDWSPTHLAATVSGRRPQQTPHLQVKAVTYHDLLVVAEGDAWTAQVYFDI